MTCIRKRWCTGALGATVAAAAAVAGLASTAASASRKTTTLTLVAYSTPKEAYARIIPAFQKTPGGDGVDFVQSYGASGDQAKAILNGLKADVVELSLEPDMTDLVKAGLVSKGWTRGPTHGIVTDSVVVFVLRDGNPKHIRGWNDLVKPGVEVITPNPFTSGGARWNVLAAYGAQRKDGKTDRQAQDFLLKLFRNVSVQDKSARDALNTFLSGKGDVLLTYENEAILSQRKGQKTPYVIPRNTILIENPLAIVSKSEHVGAAKQFVTFLRSPVAQRIFGENGYRPVLRSVAARFHFPKRPGLFTISQLGLGGWAKAQPRFFEPDHGIMAGIEKKVGG